MTKTPTPKNGNTVPARKPWSTPRVDRIEAGQAEVFTRTTADGPFATS